MHCPLCSYDISELSVGVALKDHPVGYAPPKGPSAEVTISYNQWEADQPANFNFFNIGPKWTFNWLTYIQDDPTAPGANVSRYLPGGGADLYSGYDRSTRRFAPAEDDASVLVLQKEAPVAYQRFLTDGSVETYAESDGSRVFPRNVFLTRITDPQGNTLSLNYGTVGGRVRLVSVTDATGRRTTFSYGLRISPLLITRITDPFGRSAVLSYDGSGRLTSITDVIGLTSKFSYDASGLVDSLTTPYGTTRFAFGGIGNRRFVSVIDPLGYGEREETFQPAVDVPFSEPSYLVPQLPPGTYAPYFNQFLLYRDSFHWNKHQYALAGCTPNGGCDYHDARITHFTHDPNDINIEWYTIESRQRAARKPRLVYISGTTAFRHRGRRSGYLRPAQLDRRVLDDGQTQLAQFAYNSAGNPTAFIDPVGRTTTSDLCPQPDRRDCSRAGNRRREANDRHLYLQRPASAADLYRRRRPDDALHATTRPGS